MSAEKGSEQTGRERPANYISICNNIADSYPDPVHGIQKDAIQNSMDARRSRRQPVKVAFEVVARGDRRFLLITDENTVGLTGDVKYTDDFDEDLTEEDHWARFESFAFTKDDPDALGARGQGKFIFLRASSEYEMYYDTLREDGVYRLGGTQARKTGCPIFPDKGVSWDGDAGRAEIRSRLGLEPLAASGTRVMVVDPRDEVLEAIRDGSFTHAIVETWFRAIEKGALQVRVRRDGDAGDVALAWPYPPPVRDTRDCRTWILGTDFKTDRIRLTTGEEYRVKSFSATYWKKLEVPEDDRGIALVHNGMKIQSLDMELAPPEIRTHISGYIEFDRELDRELRRPENQNPNHYELRWRKRLPQAIKQYVAQCLDEFGKAKLGLGKDPRETKQRRRSAAEDWAMRQMQRYAKDLDLFGGKTRVGPPPVPPIEASTKLLGVSIANFTFPDAAIAPRINRGQSFKGLKLAVFDSANSDRELDVYVAMRVHRGDQMVLDVTGRERFELAVGQRQWLGPYAIPIEAASFSVAGEYRLKATMTDAETGDELDSVGRRFWVDADPPLRAPFSLEPARGFPPPNDKRQWLATGTINNSPTLFYNALHPAHLAVEDDDAVLRDYLLSIMLEGALYFVLNRPDTEEGVPDYHPLEAHAILGSDPTKADPSTVPGTTYTEIARYMSNLRWRMWEEG